MGFKLSNGYIINNEGDQIEYNKRNIEKHFEVDRVLADFGIKIIGRVDTAEELPSAEGYEYGDAFAVGLLEDSTYDYWICTRPFEEGESKHWFDIGPLQIVGPDGPRGPEGPKGDTGESTQWQYTQWLNSFDTEEPDGTMIMISTGDVYRAQGGKWVFTINIKGIKGDKGDKGNKGDQGVQGIQGPIGPQGPRGLGLVILGELNSVDALPEPNSVRRDGAYLIGDPKHLWAITGTGALEWEDLGEYALTSSGGGSKLYLHNVGIYFDLHGTNTYLAIKIINSSSDKLTLSTIYSAMENNMVGVMPRMDYGNSSYFLMTSIGTTSDGYDYFYSVDYVDFTSSGTFGSSDYVWSLNSVYDSVREL